MTTKRIYGVKQIVSVLLLTIFFYACNKADNPIITGTVKGVDSGKVYLQRFDEKLFFTIDSAEIKDGKFAFSSKVKLPEIYGLSLDTLDRSFLIFLDNNPVEVVLDSDSACRNTIVKGSLLHDEYVAYKQQKDVDISEYIKQHPNSLVAAYALYRDYAYRLNADEIKASIALLSPEIQKTPYVDILNKLVEVYGSVEVGKTAPSFSAETPDGKAVSLDEHLGKGYLLIDFWASWCPPCRKENPNLVRIYDKYKDKGFDILGISLDKEKDAWTKAIEHDSLTWTNISDLKFWHSEPARLYGIRVIPSNVLVDSKGIILAKNLKGDELDKYLEDLFSKK